MRSRWIGWSVAACAIATVAHADRGRKRHPDRLAAKPDVRAAAPATRPPPPPSPPVRPKATATAKAKAKARVDRELARLADDPLLARADKIEGKGVAGMVAFTFDDGPNPDTTPAVLDALHKYDVPATFFIVTRRITGRLGEKNREVLAKELDGGFLVASHTVSHTNLKGMSAKAIGHEIDQSLRTLAREAARPIGMFRAPYGALDRRGRAYLAKRGLTEVRWSIDTVDWKLKDIDQLRKQTLATILRQDGGVILMHDVKEVTAQSIGLVLDDLEAANCARLAAKKRPIIPVSLHYWLRDRGRPRAIPAEVKQRTESYRKALPARCAARPKPVEPAEVEAPPPPEPRRRQVRRPKRR